MGSCYASTTILLWGIDQMEITLGVSTKSLSIITILKKHVGGTCFWNIRELLKILRSLLIGSVEAELFFFCVRQIRNWLRSTRFFKSNSFFSTQPQCCLTFSWIELRYWLIHISIIIPRHFFQLVYLYSCLDVCILMYGLLCDFSISYWFLQTCFFFRLFFKIRAIIFGWYHGWRIWIIFK